MGCNNYSACPAYAYPIDIDGNSYYEASDKELQRALDFVKKHKEKYLLARANKYHNPNKVLIFWMFLRNLKDVKAFRKYLKELAITMHENNAFEYEGKAKQELLAAASLKEDKGVPIKRRKKDG